MNKITKNIPKKYRIWIEARKRHKLTDLHIQMARELGMNPKKFGKIDNHKQEQWKAPLPEFIEHCYQKRFKRDGSSLGQRILTYIWFGWLYFSCFAYIAIDNTFTWLVASKPVKQEFSLTVIPLLIK